MFICTSSRAGNGFVLPVITGHCAAAAQAIQVQRRMHIGCVQTQLGPLQHHAVLTHDLCAHDGQQHVASQPIDHTGLHVGVLQQRRHQHVVGNDGEVCHTLTQQQRQQQP